MRLIIALLILVSCAGPSKPAFDLVISKVTLIDVINESALEDVNVYVTDGLITQIDSGVAQAAEKTIDGSGKYLIPGLFDGHVHTSNYARDFPTFIQFGVTSVFITGGGSCTDDYFASMRKMGDQDSIPAPNVFHTSQHFSMEGRHPMKTYASSNWRDGETIFLLKDTSQIPGLVEQVAKQPISGIKLTIEDGPHLPLVDRMPQEFINTVQKEAEKKGLEVFAHVSDNVELQMAVDAGIRNLLHYTGVDIDFERDQELLNRIYDNNMNWVTTLMLDKSFLYPLHPEWIEKKDLKSIYDPIFFESFTDPGYQYRAEDYLKWMQEYLKKDSITLADAVTFQVQDIIELSKNGVNMVVGTDTGNDFIFPGYSVHEEMELLEMGGMDPMQILQMATINAALMLKVDCTYGSIDVGKQADMILLDQDPLEAISNSQSISQVIKNGRVQKSGLPETK